MKTRILATFVFEHETVLGDLLDFMRTYKAQLEKFCPGGLQWNLPHIEGWYITFSFADEISLNKFTEELGRDPI